jgi:D-3-phosphoglycerate dehydrogenase
MDNVDLEAAKALGIKVFNTPDAPTRSVAELTLAHILSLLRRIPESDRSIRNGKWQPLMGSILYEQTVGIIGFGRIGKMVNNLLTAFGAQILIHDEFARSTSHDLNFVSKEDIFSKSDIVTLHLPYSKENHHLVNQEMISRMRPTAFLVNVSRGGLIDDNALYQAVSKNKIAGAALDCFEEEPYAGPLVNCDRVQLSAHMGSYASQSRVKQEQDSCTVLMNELKIIN